MKRLICTLLIATIVSGCASGAKNDKIAELESQLNALKNSASQTSNEKEDDTEVSTTQEWIKVTSRPSTAKQTTLAPTPTPTPQPTTPPTTAAPTASPTPIAYLKADYKEYARNPDKHTDEFIQIKGKVVQAQNEGALYILRVAQESNYNNIWYITYFAPEGSPRILDDDNVTVQGMFTGIETYTTIMGGSVSIPSILAVTVTLNE